MNLSTETISNLRTLLVLLDSHKADLIDLASRRAQADAAAARLSNEIDILDKQASEGPAYRIPANQERLAALIAGAEVPIPDKKDIEAHAKKGQALAAQRTQLVDDLTAVQSHIQDLASEVGRTQKEHDAAELKFLSALGEAQTDAYKEAAEDFVRTYMPPLHSIANLIAQKTGKLPDWWHLSAVLLRVVWMVPNPVPEHQKLGIAVGGKEITVWPRFHSAFSDKLIGGEPSNSPEIVDALIAAIRDPEATLSAKLSECVLAMDTNLAASDRATAAAVA